ncbi:Acyl-CoA N-acyltransferase [Pseudocohnilembus persalinus]|uniref:Acyl-CoA N-acyltransferase n=1 Tax=Pseudocohnilembus persalinus TaxID=266149 RepID=A0A0V0QMK5_PSEPJ|nr:Acyl-CoA N-acyltransferase [Pseudocohnilembus persalinus]|eukprot:KRX03490.1 Acyl-CoA N-acyltransferase [Pseudocohnilembus persalinus]
MEIITYQRCVIGEEEQISQMIQKVFEDQISKESDMQKYFSKFSDPETFSKRVFHGKSFALTAKAKKSIRDKGEIVGIIEISDYCHLNMIFVDPKHQRKGIASYLLEIALETCKQFNKGIQQLTVAATSNALPFFVKYGFIAQEDKEEAGAHLKKINSHGSDQPYKVSHGLEYLPMQFKIKSKGNFHQQRV